MDISDSLNELGSKIISDARAICPVDTGLMRDSLRYEIDFKSLDNFNITFLSTSYSKFVNSGTRYQKAQPFMTNAIQNNISEGVKDITKQLTNDMISQIKIKLK